MRHHFSKKRFKNKHILNQLFFLFIVLIIAMRWLPTLSFSPSNNSSASSSSSAAAAAAAVDHRRKAWLFGTRPKKLHHVVDHDGRSPTRWQQDSDEDATVSLSYSPTDIRSSTSSSVGPHPLPLPDAAASLRQRDGDYRLPSPKDVPGATDTGGGGGGGFRALEDRDLADGASVADGAPPTGFRMRSVFASQDTRRNMEHSESARDTNWAGVPGRSSSGSPFASPKISPHRTSDDFVPYRYVAPKGNQFWSAPEMHTSEAGLPPPAFFDLSALGTETSPCQSSQGRSPHQQHRSSSGPPSPIHPMKALETSTARHESNGVSVHRLPLPPAAALSSPTTAAAYFHAVAKSESLPMKSQWQKGKLIGRGTFGSVYVATNRETGALCAMKEVELLQDDPKSAESIKQLEQEIKLLSNLKHSNIVQYYGSEIVEDRFYIYLEYVHPGSINKYVREHCGAITESVIRNFTRHILSGLAYLHSKKTIHRDIKGANLLVDSAGVVKLADFGMAKHLTGLEADLSLKGSPYWMAPELMQVVMQKDNSSDVAFAIDIWSLGCTIIEMFTGKPPWSEYEGAAAMFKVMRDTPSIPETLSSNGKDFLRCCFIRNPAERPTAAVLLEHRFLKSSHMPDVTSSTQIYNGTNFMDKPYSPHTLRRQPENIPDQNSISTARISKGKAAVRRGFLIPSLDILPAYQNQ